ncbi:MAG: NTE family protein, partial [Candidatus Omnitrophota bacterium]
MKKLGIALGSGAARGWAHIGVLEALIEGGLSPEIVTGTSIGSIIGAVYACDRLPEIKEVALSLDVKTMLYEFVDMGGRSGMIDGGKVTEFIRSHIKEAQIEDLGRPFACVAADVLTGEAFIFKKGDLINAIRCSISIPGIFTPIYFKDRVLVDGGVVNPVPVDVARKMGADVVIAVDINEGFLECGSKSVPKNYLDRIKAKTEQSRKDRFGWVEKIQTKVAEMTPDDLGAMKRWLAPDPIPNMFDVLGNSLRIMEKQITDNMLRLHPADVVIRPAVGGIEIFEFNRAEEAIQAGYEAGQAALPAILEAMHSDSERG